jgi:gas vesicle protein
MNRFVTAALLTAALALLPCARAQACGFGQKAADSYKTMGLTDTQSTQLEVLRADVKKVREETDTKTEALRKQMEQELVKKAPDQKLIATCAKQQGELKTKVSQKRADALLKAKKLVSAQQFAKLIEMEWGCRCGEDATAAPVDK